MQFKKLKKGSILFVIKENHGQNTIHAISLDSPTLKHSNYKVSQLETGWNNIDEVRETFNEKRYGYIENDDFPIDIFDQRLEHIKNHLFSIQTYKKTG